MKFTKSLLALLLLSISLTARSEAPQPPAAGGPDAGKGAPPVLDQAKVDEHIRAEQENLLKMHDLSNKILAETDPQKQQALKDQQFEMMKARFQQMLAHRMPPRPPQ